MTTDAEKSQTKGHREADFAFLGKFNGEGKSDLDYEKDSVNFFKSKLVEGTRPTVTRGYC